MNLFSRFGSQAAKSALRATVPALRATVPALRATVPALRATIPEMPKRFQSQATQTPGKEGSLASSLVMIAVIGSATFVLTIGYVYFHKDDNSKNVLKAFSEKKQIPLFRAPMLADEPAPPFLERDKAVDELIAAINSNQYLIVIGERGCGKTTLAKMTLNKLESGVYFSPMVNPMDEFAAAIGFNPYSLQGAVCDFVGHLISGRKRTVQWDGLTSAQKFTRLIPFLDAAAQAYSKEHHKPAVLIIDNCNKLVADKELMDVMLLFAKEHADNRSLSVVFVTSDGSAPASFAKKNLDKAMIFVPLPVTRAAAVEYLQKRSVPTEIGERAYMELTNGHPLSIVMFADDFHHFGNDYEATLKSKIALKESAVCQKLGVWNLAKVGPLQKIFAALCQSPTKTLSQQEVKKLLSEEDHKKLINANVLKVDAILGTTQFHDQLIETLLLQVFKETQ